MDLRLISRSNVQDLTSLLSHFLLFTYNWTLKNIRHTLTHKEIYTHTLTLSQQKKKQLPFFS